MNASLENFVMEFENLLQSRADAAVAQGASAYMRNLSEFVGVKAPVRREYLKQYLKMYGLPPHENLFEFVKLCWERPYREMQYFGMEVAEKMIRKPLHDDIEAIEYMIVNKSWWDTVDFIAVHLAGIYFLTFTDEKYPRTRKWMESGNLWLQRSALLFQLNYKKQTDLALLFAFIEELSEVREFFIEKAIGWALRHLSRTYPTEVQQFVESHSLRPLSRREALRLLNK